MKLLGRINDSSYAILWILLLWLVLNLFSAYYTGLAHDETYYWVFSQNLDWGYLDHPPMTAIIIHMGQFLFDNALGVRVINVIINVISLFLLWKICKPYGRDVVLFATLIFGLITFHVYSFIIVPDAPLLASCILYFWFLKKYLLKDSIINSLLLAVSIAFMIYSKYHGFLIILFTIVALPKLVFKKSFWIVAVAAFILFLPHIIWQISQDAPSIEYHFFGRGNAEYDYSFTTNYILGLLLVTGPLLAFILWYAVFKVRSRGNWERVLKITVFGFAIFFLLASFRSKIEPNWNSPLLISMFILSYKYLIHKQSLRKWTIILGSISLVFILGLRVYAANDLVYRKLSPYFNLKSELYYWEDWALKIEDLARGKPVVFLGSYQMASKYSFYTWKVAYSYNSIFYRKNQFDLWDIEAQLQGKDVLVVSKPKRSKFQLVETAVGDYHISEVDNFRSYNHIKIDLLTRNMIFEADKNYDLRVKLTNNFPFQISFEENNLPVILVISIFQHKEIIQQQNLSLPGFIKSLEPKESLELELPFMTKANLGDYYMHISLKPGNLDPGLNSRKIRLNIK